MYLQVLFSCAYTNFIFFGYPIVQLIFGSENVYILVMMNIVQCVFVVPFHTFLMYKPDDQAEGSRDDERHSEDAELEDIVDQGRSITPVEPETNPDEEHHDETDSVVHVDETEHHAEEEEVKPVEEKVNPVLSRSRTVLWAIVTPMNVCIVLGVVWSATTWDIPVFLDEFVNDFEKAVMGAGLLAIGMFMREHKFCGFNVPAVLLFLVIHFVANPLISALWAWVVGMDPLSAKICTFAHAMPVALMSYVMAFDCGYGMKLASFTFFYSNFIALGLLVAWIAVFNELGLFDEDI